MSAGGAVISGSGVGSGCFTGSGLGTGVSCGLGSGAGVSTGSDWQAVIRRETARRIIHNLSTTNEIFISIASSLLIGSRSVFYCSDTYNQFL